MTEEDKLLLNDLKAGTKQLFLMFNNLENEKKLLEEKVSALQMEIKRLEWDLLELGRKNEQLNVANRILSGKDEDREAKKKINKLVREIDKCIALLNK